MFNRQSSCFVIPTALIIAKSCTRLNEQNSDWNMLWQKAYPISLDIRQIGLFSYAVPVSPVTNHVDRNKTGRIMKIIQGEIK